MSSNKNKTSLHRNERFLRRQINYSTAPEKSFVPMKENTNLKIMCKQVEIMVNVF